MSTSSIGQLLANFTRNVRHANQNTAKKNDYRTGASAAEYRSGFS
ncbi:hypothetical protein J2W70_000812 [Pseudomonas koreensis]|nr:hypothetical protein [Pseudomonas koreensis]